MRQDTPPRSNCSDDEFHLGGQMDFNDMLAQEGVLVDDDDDENAFDEDLDDDDELELVELEELERRLAEPEQNRNGSDDEDEDGEDDDGIGMRATPEDKAVFTFSGHTQPVFTCHIHPEHDVAVTGGQDDVAYVWNMHDGHIFEKITDHTDTLAATKFNYDGNYLLTADMAGNICVFRLQINIAGNTDVPSSSTSKATKLQVTLNKVWSYCIGDMSWGFWHDRSNILFASSAETGEIYMWRIPSGDCKVFVGPGNGCVAGELSEDGKKLFASYNDGSLRLWDLRSGTAALCINDQHANEIVPSVACDKNGSLYASGDRNGKILFSTQSGPVNSVQTSGLVECLEFSPSLDLKMLASATLEGETTIWDYAHFTKRVTCVQPDDEPSSICCMKWLNGNTLAIGTAEGDICIYDARSGILKQKLTGHCAHIYEFHYSRRTNTLLSVSEDNKAKLFSIPELDD